jgi:ABC-2 type transport system ATP-binding protein
MSEDIARFEAVTAGYGGRPVLEGLELAVRRGAVYALLARNGEGKTTAVRCLLGLEPIAAGKVSLFGADPWSQRTRALGKVAYVPEEPDAPPGLTAPRLGRAVRGLMPRWDGDLYASQLDRAGVPRDVPFGRLSRGEKAHVGLALALASRPDFLVLDDPTLGLDHVARRGFYGELIDELVERGVTVFITSHDIAAVEKIATHVGVLRDGKLALDMELEALKAGFRRVRFDRGAHALPARPLRVESGLWGVEAILADYQEALFASWREQTGAEIAPMSLEEIFVAVAGGKEVA